MPIIGPPRALTPLTHVPTIIFGGAATIAIGLSVGASTSSKTLTAPKLECLESGATLSRRLSQRPVLRNRLSEATTSLRQRPTGALTAAHLDRLDKTIEECMHWFN